MIWGGWFAGEPPRRRLPRRRLPDPAGERETRRKTASRDRRRPIRRVPEIAQAPSRRQPRIPAKEAADAPSTIGWSPWSGARSAIGHATAISSHSNITAAPRRPGSSASNRRRGTVPWVTAVLIRPREKIPLANWAPGPEGDRSRVHYTTRCGLSRVKKKKRKRKEKQSNFAPPPWYVLSMIL